MKYDIVVIGGGPAGSCAATFLQRKGLDCLVVERSSFPRYQIGESLIPHTYGTLSRLGLVDKLRESSYPVKHSVRFISRDSDNARPFYFSETIEGDAASTWQVERGSFDQMCLDHAVENGATVRVGECVDGVVFDDQNHAVGVRVRSNGTTSDIGARVVVDASGRATVIGNQLGLKEGIPSLQKSSVWSYYHGGARESGVDAGETTIVLLPDCCWAWYIPLPDNVVSVGIVGSADVLFAGDVSPENAFARAVATSPALTRRLAKATRVSVVRGGSGYLAYRNRQTSGHGWVMLGDARAFLDPIYSSGVFLALESAEQAASCIHAALLTDDVSATKLGAFEPRFNAGVGVISRLIHEFYSEQFSFSTFLDRFPDQRRALIDCLVGDVFKDMSAFTDALDSMTNA